MGERGTKPQGKVKIKWSPNFAYAVGLLVTDGNLSKDGRHIDFTSKDKEQILNFMRCLNMKVKIGNKKSGTKQRTSRSQFGDVLFYRFLISIGLFPNKSKTLGEIKIPSKYLFDFLRGHFDGDGTFYSYWDPRWRSSFMFYTEFISASRDHILWIRKIIDNLLGIKGHITTNKRSSVFQLKYAKEESLKLLPMLYYNKHAVHLARKREKIEKALKVTGLRLR